jgi:predicted secreted protein
VTLPETATTGYRWQAEVDEHLLRETSARIDAPTLPRGAPGSRTITFQAIAPGPAVAKLVKRRPWESEPGEEFTVDLEITHRS